MQNHITREIEAAANAQVASATDALAAAIQFVRTVAEEQAAIRAKAAPKLPLAGERKAAAVDDAISSAAESSEREYVQQIARGEGPAQRQQFSLGNQLTWSPGRALPQFLFQGKPILLTDPEQVARWDRLAKQEAQEDAPGAMAQIFKAQRKPAPRDIAAELEKSAEGKIIFQSADRPGWDKVIYYHAGEKGAAERLAEILRNNRELTEQQQAEVWRLEGWPEADIARELQRMRHVQRMHDESWWTPQPSLMERARERAKNLLSFGRAKKVARPLAKAAPEQAQPLLLEVQRPREQIAEFVESAPLIVEEPMVAEVQRSRERIARLPQGAPFKVDRPAKANGANSDISLAKSSLDPSETTEFHQTGTYAAVRRDLHRALENGDVKVSARLTRRDEPIFRWLDAAMEDVHRHTQNRRPSLKGKR